MYRWSHHCPNHCHYVCKIATLEIVIITMKRYFLISVTVLWKCLNLNLPPFSLLRNYRFTYRMKVLTGIRGIGYLYAYMFLGLGFLRAITPDFGALTSKEQQLDGSFR